MARPRKRPEYDPEKIMKELMTAVAESYEETGELKITAEEFGISALKVRKLLITAGVYSNDVSDEVNELYDQGKSLAEIEKITGLRKSSINGYLPYSKVVYKPQELSLNAERIKQYRLRREVLKRLYEQITDKAFREAVMAFQNYLFSTVWGQRFTYELKTDPDKGTFKELIIRSHRQTISLSWRAVMKLYRNALALQGDVVRMPDLGDTEGVQYLYSIFYKFGLISVPRSMERKLETLVPVTMNKL